VSSKAPAPTPLQRDTASALAKLLADAARVNARVPEQLKSYRARIESEMSLVVLDSGRRERTAQLEQVESDVRWRAPDRYDQRVIGYRHQSIGPMFSLMSFFGGWTIPTLYGNQLQLGLTSSDDPNTTNRIEMRRPTVHPLAFNRDRYYTFTGGDTAVTLYSNGRQIPIARVLVTPRTNAPGDAILFYGEMYLDADWKQIVRMRGRLVEVENGKATLKSGSRLPGVGGASFVELVNTEVNGQYWLPAFQRTEIEARIAIFGEFRAIIRVVSRFRDYNPNDSSWSQPESRAGVTRTLTFASSSAQERFNEWQEPLGAASRDVYYGQFDDLAPEEWREAPVDDGFHFRPRALGEVFRFNRIEGVFTGVAIERDFGAPKQQLSLHASGGWAWAEQTARGIIGVERQLGHTLEGMRVERTLTHTNDFQLPFNWGSTLSALFGSNDDFDYLDRTSATLFATRALGAQQRSVFQIAVGPARDRAVQQNISRGLFVDPNGGFRPNRGIREGGYFRSVASLDVNPEISGEFVDRGVGTSLRYDRADGKLRWQRLEFRTAIRRELGPFQLYARGDAGTLIGDAVPQMMFEIGGSEGLTGYDYKEFAGDRAALGRAVLGYTFPFLRAPMHLPSQLIVPGISPGVAAGIHAGWTGVSNAAAEAALLELGTRVDSTTGLVVPVSQPTRGVRASAEFLLTFFSGSLSMGVSRPIDRSGPWKFTGRIGQGF
jgi:hypothetical protein